MRNTLARVGARRAVPLLPAGIGLFLAGRLFAAGAWETDPNVYSVRLENEHVRMLDVHYPPGKKVPTHSHPAHLLIVLEDARLRITEDGNIFKEKEFRKNEVSWVKAGSHEMENIGETPFRAYLIEVQ